MEKNYKVYPPIAAFGQEFSMYSYFLEILETEGISKSVLAPHQMQPLNNITEVLSVVGDGKATVLMPDTIAGNALKLENLVCSFIKNEEKPMHRNHWFRGRTKYRAYLTILRLAEAGIIENWYAYDFLLHGHPTEILHSKEASHLNHRAPFHRGALHNVL